MCYTTMERNYSCSYFPGNNQTPPEVIKQFENAQENCLLTNIAKISHQLDISYGDQTYDLWGSHTQRINKIFAFLHGGYWTYGDKRHITSVVPALTNNGIHVACIGYTLAPFKTLPAIVEEVRSAIRFISDKYPDSEIILSGHSAGAHLVLKALENCGPIDNVNKIVLFCGIYFLMDLIDTYIGRDMNLTPDTAKRMSINTQQLDGILNNRKVLIVESEHDAPKVKEQNAELLKELRHRDINTQHKIVHGVNHFSIIESLKMEDTEQTKALLDFIRNA